MQEAEAKADGEDGEEKKRFEEAFDGSRQRFCKNSFGFSFEIGN